MIAAPGSTPAGQTAEHFERGVAAPGPVGVVDQAEHGPRVRVARFLRDDLAGAAGHLDTVRPLSVPLRMHRPLPPCWAPP
jgi:hypothetical protein